MKIIAYDSETTGIPSFHEPSDAPHQPHILQLAAVLFRSEDGEELEQMNVLVKPEGWEWDETNEAFQVHGISVQRCLEEGITETEAVALLLEMAAKAELRIGHNETFDRRMVRIALKRNGLLDYADTTWKEFPSFCTCNRSRALCNLPHKKKPKLAEAYEHFFGEKLEGGHDALVDVRACIRIYFAIQEAVAA